MYPVMLLKSKLTPPQPDRTAIRRARLQEKLGMLKDYAITVVTAGAGYGKTTAVAQVLPTLSLPCGWYTAGPEDDNIYVFSVYLAGALETVLPGLREWYIQNIGRMDKINWKNVFAIFMSGVELALERCCEGVLVVDDWHLVQCAPEIRLFMDRFLACKPATLRIVFISRENMALPEVDRLRAQGAVLDITEKDLAFDTVETELFIAAVLPEKYSPADVHKICRLTEGWIMAIKLMTSTLTVPSTVHWPGQPQGTGLNALFSYLAHHVLECQPPALQTFLLQASVLPVIDVYACQEVLGKSFDTLLIQEALRRNLFLTEVSPGTYRFHRLFQDFLQQEAEKKLASMQEIYVRASDYYLRQGDAEQALSFLLKSHQWDKTLTVLSTISRDLVYSGRGRLLRDYLRQLPTGLSLPPDIVMALGDEARFACQYKDAVGYYEQALQSYQQSGDSDGVSRAYRGLGEVYLDIIEPARAQTYLRQAYKVLPRRQVQEKAAILGLMAENMINRGNPRRAERYRRMASEKFYYEDKNNLEARILLRTGRICEATKLMERQVAREYHEYRVPCSFRESTLILSLCYAYMGEAARAQAAAEEGIRYGEKMHSPFVVAVGNVRLGHALLINQPRDKAKCWEVYKKAWEMGQQVGVLRSRTEVLQGLCLLYGLDGAWPQAEQTGLAGIRITTRVQDRWFTAMLYHTLGMSAALCRQYEAAIGYIRQAEEMFRRCGDTFGQAAVAWWHAYVALQTSQREEFARAFTHLLALCRQHNYDFLLQRSTLLGDIAGFTLSAFLATARRWGIEEAWLERPARTPALVTAPLTPPVLHIQSLGRFRVWRDGEEIAVSQWRRESSRHLLGLLLAVRQEGLSREKLATYLWPDMADEVALRNFKVSLSNLVHVLEPHKQARVPSAFIQREGQLYRFNSSAAAWLDVMEFEDLITKAAGALSPADQERMLRRALALYEGDFLADEPAYDICQLERQRLAGLFIKAAETLAHLYVNQQRYEEAVQCADIILKQDRCWEGAYQLKMRCYGERQIPVMVARTYRQCCEVLQDELGVKPSPQTVAIYKKFIN